MNPDEDGTARRVREGLETIITIEQGIGGNPELAPNWIDTNSDC